MLRCNDVRRCEPQNLRRMWADITFHFTSNGAGRRSLSQLLNSKVLDQHNPIYLDFHMPLRLRRSPQTMSVLAVLRRGPAWHYGYDLLKQTGLKSGTLYPILARLQGGGWLEQRWEKSPGAGRPPRHLYRLSRKGRIAARELAQRNN